MKIIQQIVKNPITLKSKVEYVLLSKKDRVLGTYDNQRSAIKHVKALKRNKRKKA